MEAMPRHDPPPRRGKPDYERAAAAWARYWKIMRWMVLASIVTVLLSLIYLKSFGDPVPVQMVIATIAGVGLTVLVGTGLMGLLFLSNRSGHDDEASRHIFGGWVLSQMDIAAGIVASRRAKGPVATVAIEAMKFIAPIHLRDLISVYAHVERVGRTSMGVRIEVLAQRDLGQTEVKVTEGLFTFVALDEDNRPRTVDRP